MLPLAPARLSTITCWPSTAGSAFAMRRVMVSAPPPGELGTMHRIGLTGNACPQPAAAHMHVTTAIAMSFSFSGRLFISSPPLAIRLLGAVGRDGHHSWLAGAVAPGMVGASLDDEFARLDRHFLRIENQYDLALKHNAEIQRAHLLHIGMRRVRRVCGGPRSAHR